MEDWKGRRVLIICAAPCDDLSYIADFLADKHDCIVMCADGGMKYADALGIIPDVVVSDFDSSVAAIPCSELVRLQPEKDDTDTQHCVQIAIDRGCTDITLVCATGGRIDHLMANLLLCETAFEKNAKLTVIDKQNTVMLYLGKFMQFTRKEARQYISIIPLDYKLSGVTITGVKYPLRKAELSRSLIISVSNEATEETFAIEIEQGRALIIFSEDIKNG